MTWGWYDLGMVLGSMSLGSRLSFGMSWPLKRRQRATGFVGNLSSIRPQTLWNSVWRMRQRQHSGSGRRTNPMLRSGADSYLKAACSSFVSSGLPALRTMALQQPERLRFRQSCIENSFTPGQLLVRCSE